MAVLPDHSIENLCVQLKMIQPFDPFYLNPASLDVRLGDTLLLEGMGDEFVEVSIEETTKDEPYLLMPNQFALAHTIEKFYMPANITGTFALKSSLARAGFEHLLAGWIDPGFWDSVLTLELKNAKQYTPIPLWKGMRIGQVIFERMSAPPVKSYRDTGRYNHDHTVKECKGLS